MSVAEIDEGVFEATATIDNGSFGTRTIRFETGRLAQQAAGAVVAYLDDETMLLSATTAVAAAVQMHTMAMDGDVMTMREVDAVDLGAGQTVEFKPGGFHLMLMGLKAPLKLGDKFPMTLRFEKAGKVEVMVHVQPVSAPSGAAEPGREHSH